MLENKINANITANDLFHFWTHIHINMKHWEKCDVILTCPLTHEGAVAAFENASLFLLKDVSDLYSFFCAHKHKIKTIGIVSPYIVNQFIKDSTWLVKLIQLCSDSLVLTRCDMLASFSIKECLTQLHHVGFYHILTLFNQDNLRYLSQEIPEDAIFSPYFYYSYFPGVSNAENYSTHVACRMHMEYPQNTWVNVLGQIEYWKNYHLRCFPEQLAISTKRIDKKSISSSIHATIIRATVSWNKDLSAGNASLVTCYHGPTDSNMYALMFRGDNASSLSILKSDGFCQWSTLGAIHITTDMFDFSEKFTLSLWLKTTSTQLIAGTGDTILLTVMDDSLARNHSMGIRLHDNQISLSNIQTEYLTENGEKI